MLGGTPSHVRRKVFTSLSITSAVDPSLLDGCIDLVVARYICSHPFAKYRKEYLPFNEIVRNCSTVRESFAFGTKQPSALLQLVGSTPFSQTFFAVVATGSQNFLKYRYINGANFQKNRLSFTSYCPASCNNVEL